MRQARNDLRRLVPHLRDGLLAVVLGLAAVGGAACGDSAAPTRKTVSFRNPMTKTFVDGHTVQAMDVGDVDGDGHLDVVVNDGSRLAVVRGDGGGRLAQDVIDGGPTLSFNVVLADMTGDGRADLVGWGADSGNVRIYPGRADGSFGGSIAYGIPAQFIFSGTVADMTGDGILDVVVQALTFQINSATASFIAVLPNRGNGVLGDPLMTPLTGSAGSALGTADFNGDGALDVAVVDPGRPAGCLLLLNEGRGTLGAPQPISGESGSGLLRTGDVDGDGRPEVLMTDTESRRLFVLHNLGGGKFQPLPTIDLGTSINDIRAADLNGDGRIDLAVVANGGVAVLHSDGSTLIPSASYGTGGSAIVLRTGDFDQDGDLDLIAGNSTITGANVAMLMNDGHGLFDGVRTYPVEGEFGAMVLGDLTGDGLTDVVLASLDLHGSRSLVIFEPLRERTTGAAAPILIPIPGIGGTGLAIGDLNNDRVPDAVVSSTSPPGAAVVLGRAAGGFGDPIPVAIDSGAKVAIGDLDGDAFLDLAVAAIGSGQIDLFSGHGDGTFGALKTFQAGDGAPSALLITNISGDGRSEVVSALPTFEGTGTISILSRSSPGQFDEPLSVPVFPPLDTLAVTDFDRNGRFDLTGSSSASVEIPLLFGAPGGLSFTRKGLDVGAPTSGVASADFNQDGWPDLAFADQENGAVLVLRNDGRGGFTDRLTLPVGLDILALGAADLSGDGKIDLAVLTPFGVIILWNTSE